jgi:hypothetical protein
MPSHTASQAHHLLLGADCDATITMLKKEIKVMMRTIKCEKYDHMGCGGLLYCFLIKCITGSTIATLILLTEARADQIKDSFEI